MNTEEENDYEEPTHYKPDDIPGDFQGHWSEMKFPIKWRTEDWGAMPRGQGKRAGGMNPDWPATFGCSESDMAVIECDRWTLNRYRESCENGSNHPDAMIEALSTT